MTTEFPAPSHGGQWSAMDVYRLARLACVFDPDDRFSPGAAWLVNLATEQADVLARAAAGDDLSDVIFEVADAAVPVYNIDRARVWTDLGIGWAPGIDVDPGMYDPEGSTLDRMAVEIFEAAHNLLTALTEEV